ncbi:phosphate starvation-inducible protein PhoH [Betaproteobacteria bacterium GR16-43]|nr:phosphate starvation-inducible protein PhoH [Betaproteobacteria bacterium GR16-43]
MSPRRSPPSEEVTFEPVDNARLAALCGPIDANLRQIEIALDVTIARRGERFAISGPPEKAKLAARSLERFYEQAKRGLTVEDVQLGLVSLGRKEPPPRDPDLPALVLPRGGDLTARTPRQAQYLRQMRAVDITFGVGPAGTGKTFLAVAAAIDAFERDDVKRIVLTRPAVEAGEKLGFLPGDLAQKIDPYLRPLYDALYDLMGYDKVARLFERGAIEIAPLAFMRGRTLNQSFVILDEAQNTTPEQMKMFLTRIGFGSKAVITGDVTQIDLAKGQASGLIEARQVLAGVRGIGFTEFQSEDVVRHPLVQAIVDAYERHKPS